ncbi:MAG: CPBP family intramembrane metalloprotease [Porphyromonadaceae bacterium]|nr:CPBP family intramembrane metalloprotease [Porphyromonadaceae bacterium]
MIDRVSVLLSILSLIGLSFVCALTLGIVGAFLGLNLDMSNAHSATRLLLSMFVYSIALFLLPLAFHPVGKRALGKSNPLKLSRELWEIITSRSSLLLLVAIATAMIVASSSLSFLSEWIIGMLPSGWGIATEDSVSTQIKGLLQSGFANNVIEFVVICLTPAVVEELFFRGTMQRLLVASSRHQPRLAILVTSVIFSLAHLSAVGFLSRLLIGVVLGYSYYYTGRIAIPILLHLINNFVAWLMLIYFY